MSQFNFGNFGQNQDPLSSLITPTGGRPTAGRQARPQVFGQTRPQAGGGFSPQTFPAPNAPRPRSQVPMSMPGGGPRPQQPLNQMRFLGNNVSQGTQPALTGGQGMVPLGLPQQQIPQQFLNWDQALANSMGFDLANQQGAMNQQYGQMQNQIGQYEQALQQGIGTLQSVGARQQQALEGMAGSLERQGQKGYDEFKSFRDQQMGRVDQDISKANEFAAQATENYRQAIGDFQDTSAQDAANAAFGMRRNAMEQSQQIDMMDISPGEKAALKQQLAGDVGNQVTQAVTGIYSNMNNTVASMKGNLSSFMGAQSQTAMAGGQLREQMGTGFGAQTLQAQQQNQRMMELGVNIRTMAEQAYASAMNQSVAMELQGRTTVAQMIQENPRQFVSMFAGMTGFLAGATTPGIGQISVPNFGAFA